MSEETKDLVLKLLQVNPKKRLGFETIADILEDPWFIDDPDFDWRVIRKRGPNAAPLVPEPSSLSPPFRNSNLPEDITGNEPMTFAEFQVQDTSVYLACVLLIASKLLRRPRMRRVMRVTLDTLCIHQAFKGRHGQVRKSFISSALMLFLINK